MDASDFFEAREPSWEWRNLTSLALTSQLLAPGASKINIDNTLQAAAAAMRVSKLETMEIWNGRKGLAMLFRYQSAGQGQPAVITWRGTWAFILRPPVLQAWEAVAEKHGGLGTVLVEELLDADTMIKSHGDAIHHLKLSTQVIRPASLRQIRMEHGVREESSEPDRGPLL